MNKELTFLRTFAAVTVLAIMFLSSAAFKGSGNHQFNTIDVQRINIVEPGGTVKMINTNAGEFPNGKDKVNNRTTTVNRKKRSGMLFFNEDGIECGGFIYDGQKGPNGHSSGLSLTYDQYDGDHVMQLLTQDYKEGDKRQVASSLVLNDRPALESQLQTHNLMQEIEALGKTDASAAKKKYQEYIAQEKLGGAPRVMLGKLRSQNNGLFLFNDEGLPRAMFYIDSQNNPKLEMMDDKGNVTHTWPDKAK